MTVLFFLGLWCAVGLGYLSNAHQRILAEPLPARPARVAAWCLGGVALLAGWQALGIAVACFGGLVWSMLWAGLWPLAPLLPLVPQTSTAERGGAGR